MVEHDCCNVLTLARARSARSLPRNTCAFVNATFSGEERHRRRLGEVIELEREQHPNPLKALHEAGQSIWLDHIRRVLLETGTLARYISGLWVTGLTSNLTIFEHAIAGSGDYDDAIARRLDRDCRPRSCFSRSRSKTSSPPTCSDRCTRRAAAPMASCRWSLADARRRYRKHK